jgi:hypothetical protein
LGRYFHSDLPVMLAEMAGFPELVSIRREVSHTLELWAK